MTTRDCRFQDTAGQIGTQEALIGCPRPVQRSVRQTPMWKEGAQSLTRDREACQLIAAGRGRVVLLSSP